VKEAGSIQGGFLPASGRTAPGPARSLRSAVRHLLHPQGRCSEQDLNFALGQMSDAFFEGLALFDPEGRVAYANGTLCRLLGRRRGELVGRAAHEVFGARNARALLGINGRAGRHEMKLCAADGGCRVVRVAVQLIGTSDGDEAGSFAVLMDITARAEAEAALRRSESDLRLLSAQLLGAQELERQRIAHELHDGIGQSLGGLKCTLEACMALIGKGAAPEAAQQLQQAGERVRAMCEDVRRIAMGLRPSTLDDLGILATLGWLAREFRAVHAHIDLETRIEVHEDEIPTPAKTALYRIAQEALNNVVTHAGARRVALWLQRRASRVELVVRDDGVGFEPARYASVDANGRGLGLASMRERAEASGGHLRLCSAPGRGTEIRVLWPSLHERSDHAP
jgi:PAS domain S-box-containing protein